MTTTSTSFANDISPIFFRWKAQMIWRFDLTDYETVKMNASIIYNMISTSQMPPPPYPPLSSEEVSLFQQWMSEGYPA